MKKLFLILSILACVIFALPAENDEEWIDGINYIMIAPFEIGVDWNKDTIEYSMKLISLDVPFWFGVLYSDTFDQMEILGGLDLFSMHISKFECFDFSVIQPTIMFKFLDKAYKKTELCFIDALYLKISPLNFVYKNSISYCPVFLLGNEFFIKKGMTTLNTFGLTVDYSLPLINPDITEGILRIGLVYRFLGWNYQP